MRGRSAKLVTGRPAARDDADRSAGAGGRSGSRLQSRTESHPVGCEPPEGADRPAAASPKTKPIASRAGLPGSRAGTVTAVSSGGFGVSTKKHRAVRAHASSATKFEQTRRGTKSDIAVGRRGSSSISRTDVIVLPKGSALGQPVTHVAKGSFSIKRANGKGSTAVSFAKVKLIDTVSTAPRSPLEKGADVLTSGRVNGHGPFDAAEVILLPSGSDFAKLNAPSRRRVANTCAGTISMLKRLTVVVSCAVLAGCSGGGSRRPAGSGALVGLDAEPGRRSASTRSSM